MQTESLIRGIRFVDSFFPSGGFAFSSGLEAAVQDGAVRNGADFARYVEDLLRGTTSRREAVAVARAHEALRTGTLQSALTADAELDGMHLGREARLASRQMGRQVMKIAAEHLHEHAVLRDFGGAVNDGRTPGHFPVSMGMILAACGWSREQTVAAYLYQMALGFVSAAMKLLPVGQREGQRLLEQWTPMIVDLSRGIESTSAMVSWSPVQDIYAMRHSRLASRLFRS